MRQYQIGAFDACGVIFGCPQTGFVCFGSIKVAITFHIGIHYDRDYATTVEGYSGLVVHGPLLATLMIGLAVRSWPARTIAGFEFRGHRPILDTAPFTVAAAPAGEDALDLWIADANGWLAMKGRADFVSLPKRRVSE